MSENPVVALLATQSTKRLREMDNAIAEQLADLNAQRVWVRRALSSKGASLDAEPEAGTPSAHNGNGKRPGRKRGSKREAIVELMRTDPRRVWLPSEVRASLEQQGIDVTVEAVRVTLRRMGDDNELVRPEDGNGWMLAPDPLSSEGPGDIDLSEKAPFFRAGRSLRAGSDRPSLAR
jgi:hypothetical protein